MRRSARARMSTSPMSAATESTSSGWIAGSAVSSPRRWAATRSGTRRARVRNGRSGVLDDDQPARDERAQRPEPRPTRTGTRARRRSCTARARGRRSPGAATRRRGGSRRGARTAGRGPGRGRSAAARRRTASSPNERREATEPQVRAGPLRRVGLGLHGRERAGRRLVDRLRHPGARRDRPGGRRPGRPRCTGRGTGRSGRRRRRGVGRRRPGRAPRRSRVGRRDGRATPRRRSAVPAGPRQARPRSWVPSRASMPAPSMPAPSRAAAMPAAVSPRAGRGREASRQDRRPWRSSAPSPRAAARAAGSCASACRPWRRRATSSGPPTAARPIVGPIRTGGPYGALRPTIIGAVTTTSSDGFSSPPSADQTSASDRSCDGGWATSM